MRNVRDKVSDPQLQAQIAAFIGQEAMHSKAHGEFNEAWRRDDYNRLCCINKFHPHTC